MLNIPETNRDTAWVDRALRTAFGLVYSDPTLSEEFLRSIYRTAENRSIDDKKGGIRLNQGIAKDVMNQPDSALYFYNLGLNLAEAGKDTFRMASAYNNIGLIHWNGERLDSALFYYRLSEELFQVTGSQRGLLSTMNNMGLIYQSLERYDESIRYFERVVQTAEIQDNPYFEAVGHQNLATTYTFTAGSDSAYVHLLKAIPIQKNINDLRGLAKSYHTMGGSMVDMDSLDRAEWCFSEAIETNLKLNNSHALASNYYNLGEVYQKQGDRPKRLSVLKKAYNLRDSYDDEELYFKSVGSYNLMLVEDWNWAVGTEVRKAFYKKDVFYHKRLEGKVLELQEAYEAEKKEQELLIKNLQIADQEQAALQRERTIWGLAILLLILVLFGLFFIRYRAKLDKLKTQQRVVAERSRISRDLHDNIGAQLTAMSTRIDLLQNGKSQSRELEQIRDEAADTVSMLRDTIWAIHREEYAVPQFMNRIRQYVNRVLPRSVNLDLNFDKKLETKFLNASEALNLFRIAQEAIQNCMKHSGASVIRIRLSRKSDRYEFLISDNGKGCHMSDESEHDNYGLPNIRERSAEIRGHVAFESERGNGFTVRVTF